MTFQEALIKLGIEDYSDRIFNSNSQGELFHLIDYIELASIIPADSWFKEWFREWFEYNVKFANEHWQRPQSVFQHIKKIYFEQMQEASKRLEK